MALDTKTYTVEDLQELGEGYELDRGVLVPVMPGSEDHGYLCGLLSGLLVGYVRPRRLGRVYANDTGFILERGPDSVRGPDVAFVSIARLEGQIGKKLLTVGPDLAIEVVATGSLSEAFCKASQYLQAGGRLVWVIDAQKRRAVVFHEDGEVNTLHESDTLEAGDVLPGFQLPLRELFEEEP